jgi:hypothetical protein
VTPSRRRESEAAIIRDVGRWIGEQALGKSIGQALIDAAQDEPVTVCVTVERADDAP